MEKNINQKATNTNSLVDENGNVKVYKNAIARCEVVQKLGQTGNLYNCVEVILRNGSKQTLCFKDYSFGALLELLEV